MVVRLRRTRRTFSTNPRQSLTNRCGELAGHFEWVCTQYQVRDVHIEIPAYAGSYTGGKERFKGVAKLLMATGAITGGCSIGGSDVHTIRASGAPKEQEHAILASVMGKNLPKGPRGGKLEDQWDAIWLGLRVISS